MTTKVKEENREQGEGFSDRYDLGKFFSTVHVRLGNEIKSDYVLAKFSDEQRKEGAINMTANAYVMKAIISQLMNSKKWQLKGDTWMKRELNKDELAKMEKYSTDLFNCFMTRIDMLMLLNRNVNNNYLIDSIMKESGIAEGQAEEGEPTLIQKATEKLKPKAPEK